VDHHLFNKKKMGICPSSDWCFCQVFALTTNRTKNRTEKPPSADFGTLAARNHPGKLAAKTIY
jgi:hypothetical protein